MPPVLSILVISHNQEQVLPRCLDSIFAQKLSVPYEVIVSDDASTDGTPEVIKAYAEKHPNLRYYGINSGDYDPAIPSDRCGINKANAYSHAQGRYVVNIDGDDYLLSEDIYESQIKLLEENPDCTLCMQNITRVKDGDSMDKSWLWKAQGLKNGDKLNFDAYVKGRHFISNPAFMMRRDAELNPIEKYGLMFDDEYITFHHLQKGGIIYLDRADYVYVHYDKSINSSYREDGIGRYSLLPLIYAHYFPAHEPAFMLGFRQHLIEVFKTLVAKGKEVKTSDRVRAFLDRFEGFMFRYLADECVRAKAGARFRVRMILYYSLLLSKLRVENKFLLHSLYKLMV